MKIHYLLILVLALTLTACGSSKSTGSDTGPTEETVSEEQNIDQKYKSSTLLNRLSRESALSIRAGVPLVTRTVAGKRGNPRTQQPLYIVDDVIIGRSYQRVAQIVTSADVKTIEVIQGPDASFYGVRGGYGVVKLTTYGR